MDATAPSFSHLVVKCSCILLLRALIRTLRAQAGLFSWSCRERKRNNPILVAFNRILRHFAFCSMFYVIGRESAQVKPKGCSRLGVFQAADILKATIQSRQIRKDCSWGSKSIWSRLLFQNKHTVIKKESNLKSFELCKYKKVLAPLFQRSPLETKLHWNTFLIYFF